MASWRATEALKLTSSALKRLPRSQRRCLSLHEYQSQDLLRQHNVPTPRGKPVSSSEEARSVTEQLGGSAVIKSQLLRDGRSHGTFDSGLQGGIHKIQSPAEAERISCQMLGHRVKTGNTIDQGLTVKRVYVSEPVSSAAEQWHLVMTIDRETYTPVINISKLATDSAPKSAAVNTKSTREYHQVPFTISEGITPAVTAELLHYMNLPKGDSQHLNSVLSGLYSIFTTKEATRLEVNPLARLTDGSFTCVSSNFTFDDAAAKRQKDLFAQRDVEHEVPEEVEAEKYGLVYVRMDGDIGNVVNGAGLAMATNDAIGLYGGKSANFLDAGGQATKETMVQAFSIVMRDERVKAMLVNVYGGITNCAMIAESVIAAAAELGPLKVPVVVRLQGTNSPQGLKLLEEADLGLYVEADFGAAAEKAVKLAKGEL